MTNDYNSIILRSVNYGESDKIIDIFTKEKGKVTALARGVRKIKGSKGTSVELFSNMNISLSRGRKFYYVNSTEIISSFLSIREDMAKLAFASYIAEITNSGINEEEENEKAFELLIKTFKLLSEGTIDYKNLLFSYQLKFMSFIGYKPVLNQCLTCGEREIFEPLFLSYEGGGVICGKCRQHWRFGMEIELQLLRKLYLLLYSKLEDLNGIELTKVESAKAEKLIMDYMVHHLGKHNFKSLKMLKTLNLL